MSKSKRKIGVIINYLFVLLHVALFEVGVNIRWNIPIIVGEIIVLFIIIISYIIIYYKSNLWKLVHSSHEKFNEREESIVNNAIRKSYQIFSITSLLIFFFYSVTEIKIEMAVVVSLIYFAHILPASIIAWTEKEV